MSGRLQEVKFKTRSLTGFGWKNFGVLNTWGGVMLMGEGRGGCLREVVAHRGSTVFH